MSGVDVMVIGKAGLMKLSPALRKAEGPELHPLFLCPLS